MNSAQMTIDSVKEYYGKVLKTKEDLQTSACCTAEAMPLYLREILKDIHQEVKDRFYGCGSPLPPGLEGKTILDLGSGTGRDVFMLSKLVGESGRVIGVDMTDEQIQCARKHTQYHMDKFGYKTTNVEFKQGYIEDLESLGIKNDSIDLVVSNCVLNLSPQKERVFSEIFRVLKPGGELYFSDVFSDRRIPTPLTKNDLMVGECLGGALYTEDFRRLMAKLGCHDYRLMNSSRLDLFSPEIKAMSEQIGFYSLTVRAFKLDLEDRCEDYGQVAYYKGTVKNHPNFFALDDHHVFETGKPMTVCQNTAKMLTETRFAEHFKVVGDTSTHYGLFDCGPQPSVGSKQEAPGACC